MEEMTYKHDHSGQRSTAIGLASAGLGVALFGGLALAWGLNKASEARYNGAMTGIVANTSATMGLSNQLNNDRNAFENRIASERLSRENWQTANTPSIQSYIDVQATPTASSSAVADAVALATAINNNAVNSAIGTESFLKVQRYSAPQPCGCDSCGA